VRAAALAVVIGAALVVGCGGGDKPSQELPDAPATMRLASPAFHNGALIPKRYTCSGDGTSPPLAILDAPAKTRELALLVEDRDADRFVHWTLLGISPDTALIGAGKVPSGAVQTENGFGDHAWGAPCPPEDDPPHHYVFAIYALDAPLGLDEDASQDDVREAIAEHALARGTLTGRFGR
jgi:Raf kinase inhibitor-like YbhB/YbcL family protein